MTSAEQQTFEMERMETLRMFEITLQHPANGRVTTEKVIAHSHATDDEGHLSFTTINIDGTRNVRDMFHERHWIRIREVGTSAHHQSKLVTH